MQDRFKFRIAVFERYNNNEWEFTKFIKNTDKFGVSTNGNVIQENVQDYIIHLTREKTPKNVYRTMEVMQCTGLKDKNGKLIYEGDIVQFYNDGVLKTMKIVWDDDELDFKAIGLKKSVECYGQDFFYLGCIEKEDNLEVIGNIYQDIELLKKEG